MPAPSRHLVSLYGDPVEELTDFSDWVQLGDKPVPGAWAPGAPPDPSTGWEVRGVGFAEHRQSPQELPDAKADWLRLWGEMMNESAASTGAYWSDPDYVFDSPSSTAEGLYNDYGGLPASDGFHQDLTGKRLLAGMSGVASGSGGKSRPTLCWAPWDEVAWLPEPPEGVVGYELEQAEVAQGLWAPLARPTRCDVAYTVYGVSRDVGTFNSLIRFSRKYVTDGGITIVDDEYGLRYAGVGDSYDYPISPDPFDASNINEEYVVDRIADLRYNMDAIPGDPANRTVEINNVITITPDQWAHEGLDQLALGYLGLFSAFVRISGVAPQFRQDGTSEPKASATLYLSDVTYLVQPPRMRWIYAGPVEPPEEPVQEQSFGNVRRRFA